MFQRFEMRNCSSRPVRSVFSPSPFSRALFFNLFGLIFILSLCCGVGLVMFAKYHACDPLQLGLIKQTDQVRQEKDEAVARKTVFSVVSIVCHGNLEAIQRSTRHLSRLCLQRGIEYSLVGSEQFSCGGAVGHHQVLLSQRNDGQTGCLVFENAM